MEEGIEIQELEGTEMILQKMDSLDLEDLTSAWGSSSPNSALTVRTQGDPLVAWDSENLAINSSEDVTNLQERQLSRKNKSDALLNRENPSILTEKENYSKFENIPPDHLLLSSKMAESSFSYLPDEMTIKIFTYVSQKCLLSSVSRVCRNWSYLAFDSTLWTSVNIENLEIVSSVDLCQLLKQIPGTQRLLTLSNIKDLTSGTLKIVTDMVPNLKKIDLGFCTFDIIGLNTIVKNLEKLESLNLEGCTCSFGDRFVVMLGEAKQLKHLNLSHCVLSDQQLIYLSRQLNEIHSLDVNGILYISDLSMKVLLTKHCNFLQVLKLDGEELSDDTMYLVSTCIYLQTLQIFFCELLTDASLKYLQNLENLQHLTLRKGPEFSTSGFLSFFKNCNLSGIRSLDVSECPDLSDKSIHSLVQQCGSKIERINLSWCWNLSEKSLISIVDHCRNLKELIFVGVDIRGDCLHRVPEEMPNLVLCDFEKCSFVNDELLENIVKEKPDIVIMNYHGEKFMNIHS
ncbi:hypothetical protein LOTGIDRAFT_231000 [Lottia gigantea]|uniref:F-box domain-containing protein n=1 Tax=Lottia gigantea TaxID=225164 RepID=V4AYD3_LOTGI|nr:hypothetical protein LOTGIDRAFT_231000 [Lottia gigantea]ESP00071.1 hypothetical protein LOTGIDRAFT_231000 [Lottia gigantea]